MTDAAAGTPATTHGAAGNDDVPQYRSAAHADWEQRIGKPSSTPLTGTGSLPPPGELTARSGTGLVLLEWAPVPGALGYLVHRADSPDGPFEPLDHLGGDVLAVPTGPYADTLVEPGREYSYAVATWTDDGPGPLSAPVPGRPLTASEGAPEGPAPVSVEVEAGVRPTRLPEVWRRMIGMEHFSLLFWDQPGPGGSDVAAEYTEALHRVRDEIGVRTARAHGTFLPETVTVLPDGGFDFSGLDLAYDRLLATGIRPVVELSFMPRELALDPEYTVFDYRALVSVPAQWERWGDLVRAVTVHLRERYGADEVATWEFEVWNEANLEVFWNGTREDYLRMYEVAARAVKSVDPRIRVGGPSSAAAGWVGALLEHCRTHQVPIDFVSTHTYGNAPLDMRPLTRSYAEATGAPEPEVLWTEWGVTPTHFHRVSDSVFAAPFLLRGMKAALHSTDALAYWVASDHFEELGWPPRLFHGGFGLLTVGNLRKPRYWALYLLSQLAGGRVPATVRGDGAEALVEALATRAEDHHTVDVLVWNGTLDQSRIDGDPLLDRTVTVEVTGLEPGAGYLPTARRVDADHANIQAVWEESGGGDWPEDEQWERLRAADRLPEERLDPVTADPSGRVTLTFPLPNPGIRLVRLTRG
ncbi:glycoside hydrolase [Streptomyces sp. NPDC005438]|uniref:GH39 family glycosyl hydrolase n=1 Tax=Streptomyces sp. NPDC005438 TaxID=3156880 RepID=UPI0033ACD150